MCGDCAEAKLVSDLHDALEVIFAMYLRDECAGNRLAGYYRSDFSFFFFLVAKMFLLFFSSFLCAEQLHNTRNLAL